MTTPIFLVSLLFLGISFIVSMILKSKFTKYSKLPLANGMSGREIAEKMLRENGIYDVKVTSLRVKPLSDPCGQSGWDAPGARIFFRPRGSELERRRWNLMPSIFVAARAKRISRRSVLIIRGPARRIWSWPAATTTWPTPSTSRNAAPSRAEGEASGPACGSSPVQTPMI